MRTTSFKSVVWLLYKYGVNSKTIRSSLRILMGRGEYVRVELPGYPDSILLRRNSSDFDVLYEIMFRKEYEFRSDLDFVPKVIVDCGANIGLASLFFKNKYPKARVISIEPDADNFKLLSENMKNKDNLLHAAIWNTDTSLEVLDESAASWGYEFVETKNSSNTAVKAYSMKSVMEKFQLDYIDILKLDVEGSEKEIFESDYHYWLSQTKVLIIELHDRNRVGCSQSVLSALSKYEFSMDIKGENLICFMNHPIE